MKDRVFIFDTTLRDGEQSPGCSMTVDEKLRMAHKLSELNVDIMEVGFPIASAGDFKAVKKVAEALPSVRVAALARCCRARPMSSPSRRWSGITFPLPPCLSNPTISSTRQTGLGSPCLRPMGHP